jgi:hypothetical protein
MGLPMDDRLGHQGETHHHHHHHQLNPVMGHNKGLPMDDKLGHRDETQHHHHDTLSWGSSIHGRVIISGSQWMTG